MNKERISELIRELLVEIGEDPDREGLLDTPRRVADAYSDLLRGYSEDPEKVVNGALFTSEANNMIIVRDIEIFSMCEHHLLPFFGRCHIGYIPKDKVLGLSKLARIAGHYARRLQLQERLTSEIARKIMDITGALGAGVVLECAHLCMMMRGVKKQDAIMTTSSVLGSFHSDPAERSEFLNLIGRPGRIL